MEADVTTDKRTCKRTESASAADRAKHIGDRTSANQVDPDQKCLTSFGDDSIGPVALSYSRDDALVDKGTAAPKPCLSPV